MYVIGDISTNILIPYLLEEMLNIMCQANLQSSLSSTDIRKFMPLSTYIMLLLLYQRFVVVVLLEQDLDMYILAKMHEISNRSSLQHNIYKQKGIHKFSHMVAMVTVIYGIDLNIPQNMRFIQIFFHFFRLKLQVQENQASGLMPHLFSQVAVKLSTLVTMATH